jgi:trimethylamine--corrinoid protein Co-methyltransferase
MITRYAELLTAEQVGQVHGASLEILESIGMLVRSAKARDLFARHGCPVDTGSGLVKFPRAVVEDFCDAFAPTFTFHGRDPQYDRTLPQDGPVVVTASSAPNIIDPVTGQERRARADDIARLAHLINALPGYDVFSISTLADDAPPGQFSLARFYPALKNCLKPVRGNTPDVGDLKKVLRLGALIAGSEEALRERPFITLHYCPVVSPLTMDVDSTEMTMVAVQEGWPCYGSIVPNAGVTAPLALAGTLAQCNAEFLALAVLMQMLRPGAPLIYATLPTVADVRTGAYAAGAIETGILHMGCAQMARYYNVPCGGYIGLTNAKVNDAQCGYETGMSTLAGVLAGADMLNMGGLLDALMAFDFAKAVIDDEIALMLKRVKRGLETSTRLRQSSVEASVEPFSEEDLALGVMAEVGPGGMFMDTLHTLKRMRSTALLPQVADRDTRDLWQEKGALDAHARALARARDILTQDNPAAWAPDVEARIRAEFKGLVAGDAVPPAGW